MVLVLRMGSEPGGRRNQTPRAKRTKLTFDNLESGQTHRVWVRAQSKDERVHASIALLEAEPPPEEGDGQTGQ